MKIYICRHAQQNVGGHGEEGGITDLGRAQSVALAKLLSKKNVGILYSSDLPRALDTAKAISAMLNLKINVSSKLREIEVPKEAWKDYIKNRHPDFDFHPGRGESINKLIKRSKKGLDEVVKKAKGRDAVIVCHGIFIKALLYGLGYKDYLIRNDHVANTGVTTLEYNDGEFKLVEFNYYKHLFPLRIKEIIQDGMSQILKRM
jgi:broad specificity phosphatase PhoE